MGPGLTVNQPPHGFAGSSPASPTSLRLSRDAGHRHVEARRKSSPLNRLRNQFDTKLAADFLNCIEAGRTIGAQRFIQSLAGNACGF